MRALQISSTAVAVWSLRHSLPKSSSVLSESVDLLAANRCSGRAPGAPVVASCSGSVSACGSFRDCGSVLSVGVLSGGRGAVRSSRRFGGRARSVVCMAAASAPVEVLVKAAVGHPDQLGDCPFSQRVLLTLEEKGIPYEAKYIDSSNKPEWFLEANPEGKVPVIKDEGKWVPDSDVIAELLEKKFPEPSLAAPPIPVGGKLFGAFVQFLVSKDPSDGKEEALVDELKSLDTHLKEHGPYLNGEKISAPDLALAPKLYHLKIALGHYKKWSIPADLTSLNSYIVSVQSRDSFVKTKAAEAVVVKGWEAKVLAA